MAAFASGSSLWLLASKLGRFRVWLQPLALGVEAWPFACESLSLSLIAIIFRMSRFIFYLKVFRRKSSSRFALTRPSPSKLGPFRVWLLTRPLLSKLGPFCVWLLTRPWLSRIGLFRVWLQVFRRKFSSRFARKFKFKFHSNKIRMSLFVLY